MTDFVPNVPSVIPDESSNFLHEFRHKNFYLGQIKGMEYLISLREQAGIYIYIYIYKRMDRHRKLINS